MQRAHGVERFKHHQVQRTLQNFRFRGQELPPLVCPKKYDRILVGCQEEGDSEDEKGELAGNRPGGEPSDSAIPESARRTRAPAKCEGGYTGSADEILSEKNVEQRERLRHRPRSSRLSVPL